MQIDGSTKIAFLVADPVHHVRTPGFLNAHFAAERINTVLIPVQVATDHLAEFWASCRFVSNLAGIIVTIPHKSAAFGLCDEVGENGSVAGAINIARRTEDGRFVGDAFDGEGFVAGLLAQGHEISGRSVLMIGAGGAASAICFSLVRRGAGWLHISNRSPGKAEQLAASIMNMCPNANITTGEPAARFFDLVVNGTSLGMRTGDPLPYPLEALKPEAVVAEVVMAPHETEFLRRSAERGHPIVHGLHMIVHQIPLLAEFLLRKS